MFGAGAAARDLAAIVLEQAGSLPTADAGQAQQQQEGAQQQVDERRHAVLRLLRTLDLRYPAELDAAVEAALPAVPQQQADQQQDSQQQQQQQQQEGQQQTQ